MDGPRQQAYLNLIQQLLTCTSWEDVDTILQANAELVDADFVQMMLTLGAQAQATGEIGTAQFLDQLAIQIAEPLGLDLSKDVQQTQPIGVSVEDLTQFWLALLQAEMESGGNEAAVHWVMQQNLGLITPALGQVIALWTEQAVAQQPGQAAEIAGLVQDTCISIQEFPNGKYAEVSAIAIQGYEVVVALHADNPEERASTLNGLGVAVWTQAELGLDPAASLERAIAAFTEAADISRRLGLERDLFQTLNNLGNAVTTQAKLSLDPASNLARAIDVYTEAADISRRLGLERDLSQTLNNLGNAVTTQAKLSLDPASNLARAIDVYTEAADISRRIGFERDLSATLSNLGIAVQSQAELGLAPASNLARAIAAYTEAADIRRCLGLERDLSATLNNLGSAVKTQAELGLNPVANLERAIATFTEAADILRRLGLERDLSITLNNLGSAVTIQAELGLCPAANLERAIAAFTEAADISRRFGLESDLSATLNNLGNAVQTQAKLGLDPSANLEWAIATYTEYADISRRLGLERDLSGTLHNLGSAVKTQAELGLDSAANLERAIATFTEAADISRRLGLERDLSQILTSLGRAVQIQAEFSLDPAANLERAIAAFTEAADISRRFGLERDLSQTLTSLGSAVSSQAELGLDPAANLERAIATFTESADISRRFGLERDLSAILTNFGNAVSIQAQLGIDPARNLEQAIAALTEAADISRQLGLSRDLATTLSNAGLFYQAQAHLTDNTPAQTQTALANAYDQFHAALTQVESLRGEIGTDSEGYKRNFNEEWKRVYRGIVGVCLELGRSTEAMAYADRSKARNLTELIATREIYPGGVVPEDDRQALHRLKQQIAQEERRLQDDPNPDPTQLNQLRQQKQALEPYQPLSFKQMQALLDEDTAILEWYLLPNQFLTFTLTAQSLELRPSTEQDRQKLIDWANAYLRDYLTDRDQWRDQTQLTQRLAELSQILHLDEILAKLQETHPTCQKLILIPHLFLHLFPLHALPTANESGDGGQFLQDRFSQGVVYAPNCQVLQQAQIRRQQRKDFDRLFAIQNPTQDLQFTDLEVETLQTRFDPAHVHVYKHGQADKATIVQPNPANPTYLDTQAKLQAAHCAHFSCHGYFNFEDALKSALILANSEFIPPPPSDDPSRYLRLANNKLLDLQQCLTLEDILRLELSHCRLVTLSACETGLTDFTSTSDEYIGLPSGFILAGASNVVSTLWAVNDLSTALFMIHFYQLVQQGQAVTLALKQTQRWLRESTVEMFKGWSTNISEPLKQAVHIHLEIYGDEESPFVSPYYWAAFAAIGA
ncbi:MAG: CHAT domain-containing protein [Leptolyngbya sp. SIO1E4]|nr:CHAT domain-containing protein [Leptolyngbya sp. SIO1E4]